MVFTSTASGRDVRRAISSRFSAVLGLHDEMKMTGISKGIDKLNLIFSGLKMIYKYNKRL